MEFLTTEVPVAAEDDQLDVERRLAEQHKSNFPIIGSTDGEADEGEVERFPCKPDSCGDRAASRKRDCQVNVR